MAAIDRLYLDANVFIAMGEGSGPVADPLLALAGDQMPGEDFLFTSELTLAELLVRPYRTEDEKLIQLYDDWMNSGGWLTVGPVNRAVLWYAAVLRSQYATLKLPDAIHLSTAVGFGCTHFLTADKRIPNNIQLRHKRFGIMKESARLDVMRLDAETLRLIVNGRPPK